MSNLNPGSNIFHPTSSVTNESVQSSFSATSSVQNKLMSTVLLSTAVFFIRDKYGKLQCVRGLLEADLEFINNIKVSRCILPFPDVEVIELHSFYDASEAAFGAVVNCKSQTPARDVAIKIVASKSRVAPLKKITVPRLELCAAVLFDNLMQRI
ncbi:integrase catalytic domain-containing protein [Nephila pilipes]|uniref:Integrase catalytic domain-containing protein n=1 Tax=Nephila pilipes TaxID=299642 RepID=A0A8X6P3B4_NEPPI|nr:integrase catalytic domain-containing protein [Nephila pilipes]